MEEISSKEMFCMFNERIEDEIINCEKMAYYRVKVYGIEVKVDGEWKVETHNEYYCQAHFNNLYRFAPITKKFTYRRVNE